MGHQNALLKLDIPTSVEEYKRLLRGDKQIEARPLLCNINSMIGRNNYLFAVIKTPGLYDYTLIKYDLSTECVVNEAKFTLPNNRCSTVCLGLGSKGILYLSTEFYDSLKSQVSILQTYDQMFLAFKSQSWVIVPQTNTSNDYIEEIKPNEYVDTYNIDDKDVDEGDMDMESFESQECYVNSVREIIELEKSYIAGSKIVICCLEYYGINLFINTGPRVHYLASKYWDLDLTQSIEVQHKTNEIFILTGTPTSFANLWFLRKIQLSCFSD